ncbi:DUF6164 family protein [Pseudohongiella sp.]|uniref:DUF2007 domain-containing protein n=1 Tax=marine sediment metagenome TaxID=412755 RepID=A0A0F9V5G8_9ZZZZ|nr:DUF6164 family protein [Pseudohongiella sp.]HDZ08800.1 hypothetical protein [Pseudohongiella sp.]HEA62416.1 hypothetical protein [Pseudohongiella sp.]
MAKLLFRLRNVPEDEAAEVRELLATHDVSFYETSAGNWGISMPGLWLHHDADYPEARALLDDYQHQRLQRMRAQYLADRAAGTADTMLTQLRREPAMVITYLFIVVAVAAISILIFY